MTSCHTIYWKYMAKYLHSAHYITQRDIHATNFEEGHSVHVNIHRTLATITNNQYWKDHVCLLTCMYILTPFSVYGQPAKLR